MVFILGQNFLVLTLAELDGGNIIVLPNHVEGRAAIITDLLIIDFMLELHVVRQHEQLLNMVSENLRIQVLGVVPANIYHFADDCADGEQSRAIYAGYRFIDNNDLFLEFLATHTATNLMVGIQECDEVTLAFTEVFSHGAILSDNLIYIFYTGLSTNVEALKVGVPQDFIDTINGHFNVCIMLVQGRNLCGKISNFFFELFATYSDIFGFFLKMIDFISVALNIVCKHERKILHDFHLAL